ncbi:hypothetical protein BJV82DRAFT_515574, partial [Fennellomyces sp. T-0311]
HRSSNRPPFITLPQEYPRAHKSVLSAFWRANFPHHAHTILWRAYHRKLPTRSRLQRLNIQFALDRRCPISGEVETDRHFVWDCPVKQTTWRTMAGRFLEQPSLLSYEHFWINPTNKLQVSGIQGVSFEMVMERTFLAIWQAHWRYFFDNSTFWPNGIVAKVIGQVKRIESELSL